jgi:hypothetical protein
MISFLVCFSSCWKKHNVEWNVLTGSDTHILLQKILDPHLTPSVFIFLWIRHRSASYIQRVSFIMKQKTTEMDADSESKRQPV